MELFWRDTACAINPIGEIYKSDEFEFAKILGVPWCNLKIKLQVLIYGKVKSDEAELGPYI